MTQKKIIVSLLLSSILACSKNLYNATVLQGNSTNTSQSFTFPVGPFVTNYNGSVAFVGAYETGANNYALTQFTINSTTGIPVAPEAVTLNMVPAANPLFNIGIKHLAFMDKDNTSYGDELLSNGNRLIVVAKETYPIVYALDEITKPENIIMFSFPALNGSGHKLASTILSLTAEKHYFIFAAVTNNAGGTFGDVDSGIALFLRTNVPKTTADEKKEMLPFFSQLDAEPGTPPSPTDLRAAALNGNTPAVLINSTATFLDNIVDLHYNNTLQTLYIALKVKSGTQATDGARAIVAATIDPQKSDSLYQSAKLIFKAIAPDAAFVAGQNSIVGRRTGTDINPIISAYKVRTLSTSTNLAYLIVLGGYGEAAITKQTVYALPLVYTPGKSENGTLAQKDAIPVDHFAKEAPYRFVYRAFETAATTAGDLFTADDPAVQVGGGALAAGEISNIFMNSDAIYVTVANPIADYFPGIYYSRALFDQYGRIKGWTTWQRVFGSVDDPIFGGFVDQIYGNCTFLTGVAENSVFTVKRTLWQDNGAKEGMFTLGELTGKLFQPNQGGVRGFFDIPSSTEGVDQISLVIATGANKIMLTQTAYTPAGGVLTPIVGSDLANDPLEFNTGVITANFPVNNTNAISISNGMLSDLGPLLAATIGSAHNNGYLFIGGVNGLAVLLDENGNGWQTPPGLGDKFSGLVAGMSFKLIGNYQFVRKLIVENENLFVLSDSTLDRIDLTASDFVNGTLAITTLASINDLGVKSFLDTIVSGEFALLGTTNGFYRSSAQQNIRINSAIDWQPIALPEGLSSVLQLFAATQTGISQDLTSGTGGNVYVLSTDRGKNRANLFRFAVTPTTNGITIAELPDKFVEGHPSYFIEFADFRNWTLPDGDFLFHARSSENKERATLYLAPSSLRTGLRFAGNNNVPLVSFDGIEHLVPMVRSDASGALLLPNTNGLSCNE